MKWKNSGEMVEKEEKNKEEYFDEEQYSPWAERKDTKRVFKLGKIQVLSILLAVAIVALVAALLVLLMNGGGGAGGGAPQRVADVEKRLQKFEERLDKYDAIDEKVTAIWEQAKSFEKFKDRFDRSEASTSLRMDHLTMSLEALQKQLNEIKGSNVAARSDSGRVTKSPSKIQYHQVQPGDTYYSISKKYGLRVEDLLRMNQMKPDSVIMPGQKLVVRKATD